MLKILHDIKRAFVAVFQRPRFFVYAVIAAIAAWGLITVVMQFRFWAEIIGFDALTLAGRLRILVTSIGIWGSGLTASARVSAILIILLTGVNMAFFIYFLQHRIATLRASSLGWWGMAVSLFGVGCASCGSAILTTLLGFGTATAVVAALPFHGTEFTVLGIISIAASIVVLARKIANPGICQIST